MPSNRSGASYKPSRSSQKGHRLDSGRSQSVTEIQGSVNASQTERLCHAEADNTFLHSNSTDNATRSLSGHIKSQPEGLKQCIAVQRVPDPCRSVEKLHEFLPDCEKIPEPSHQFQVTQWIESIDGKEKHDPLNSRMEGKKPTTTQERAKNSLSSQKQKFQLKKQPQAQKKGKGKAPATKPYGQVYRSPKIQQDAMENVFQMARTMMEFQKKEEARLIYQK
ncbi:hypothetical protein O181_121411 [Austropuccinia psidii MF-1]|uniref:Uncharacterized protein n=1 Tax=Austropuccinia psidii MF-1 TaxID=1389203 RepID=A0A9Q3KKD1_9BASI|nr:hypothetical protein [Austropuccinia psidii MF-1]